MCICDYTRYKGGKGVLVQLGRILAALVLIALGVLGGVYVASSAKLNKHYAIPQQALALSVSNPPSVEHGKHLAWAISKCVECHGEDLSGSVLQGRAARVVAANLTRGQGGVGGLLTDADWVRAIRHGVGPDGRALLIMPSQSYQFLSDADLADIIAYVKSVPPVDNTLPRTDVHLLGRVLLVAGKLAPPPADLVDHATRPPADVKPAVTAEYGRYIALTGGCIGCHGTGLSGGPIPGLPPNAPHAANITPTGIGKWSDGEFFRALRVGKRPDGSTINRLMPWRLTSLMTDDEIKALLLYLRSVPPKPTGGR